MDNTVIMTMRMMAWERAKSELKAILTTYSEDNNFDFAQKIINDFIKKIDDGAILGRDQTDCLHVVHPTI